ncbi:DEAD/DEAH box helicase [Marinithermofilum abyssi]|uniref:DNA 3'-5' helicase n=1 Tax=Marinithermofilum abyssi TaxID=1571185 RepID=A0A8J2VFD3_9BACL|nr:DNA repair helicase XPB [Marinithermofilum abyssi]GGE19211.1 DEAD/DEAH box helicase [Marinithermofilum abyssi]
MNEPHSCPLVVQSNRTLLLETNHPCFEEVREGIAAFAELVKSPERIHTYRMTSLSLWNAAAAGLTAESIIGFLKRYSKWEIPSFLLEEIRQTVMRYGKVRLERRCDALLLVCSDQETLAEVTSLPVLREWAVPVGERRFHIPPEKRGSLKQELLKCGFPVEDVAGYTEGEHLPMELLPQCADGTPFRLREYQVQAVDAFYREGTVAGGNGVVVLPCGAGKTVVGLAAMARVGRAALILTPNTTSVRQWIREILDKTTLSPEQVGEYTGEKKQVRPVTVATYQILTHRGQKDGEFTHIDLFDERDWGLIIYDEVHLLPAPVFRATADLQARRRLGLTATLVREDGREEDVFSLIGPKKYDAPWKTLERSGWIAAARCTELRVPMSRELRLEYARAPKRQKYRIAAENPEKWAALERILQKHQGQPLLIIGQYVSQLEEIAERLSVPILTGKTPHQQREELYARFRRGEIPVLVVSKVANFAVDLPDAQVAVQVSGTFGSRQEEAQRLGRILRPKKERTAAHFYQIVSRDTVDQEYALHRQLYLVEQGYHYEIVNGEQWGND